MHRPTSLLSCIAWLLLTGPLAAADEWIVDTTWKPKPGDQAQVYADGGIPVLAARDIFAFGELVKASLAKDDDGILELAKKDRILLVDSYTDVLVVDLHDGQLLAKGVDSLEVRIKGGKHRGEVAWINAKRVVRLTRKPAPPAPKETPEEAQKRKEVEKLIADTAAAAAKAKARAEAAYKDARKLEVAGKTGEAIAAYRKIIKDFTSGHIETKAAAMRIKALGGK